MALYKQVILTDQGQVFLNEIMQSPSSLEFTKMTSSEKVYTPQEVRDLRVFVDEVQESLIRVYERVTETTVRLEVLFSNEHLNTAYNINSIGIFVKGPDGSDMLFGVAIAEEAFYMTETDSVMPTGAVFRFNVGIDSADVATLQVDPAGVAAVSDVLRVEGYIEDTNTRIDDVEASNTAHYNNKENPHSVTKSQIGLSNVNNTADINKPVSNATRIAMEAIQSDLDNRKIEVNDTLSTGVTHFSGIKQLSSTHFTVGKTEGYIVLNTTNEPASMTKVSYPGTAIAGMEIPHLHTADKTYLYLNASSELVLETNTEDLAKSRRDRIFLGLISHPDGEIAHITSAPQIASSPALQVRDLWEALGIVNDNNFVYPQASNLSLSLHGGHLHYSGINLENDINSPNKLAIPSVSSLVFNYGTSVALDSTNENTLKPKLYEKDGVLHAVTSGATNQRVYLTVDKKIFIQYGQKVYPKFAEAIGGLATEDFVENDTLATDAALIGIITMEHDATTLTNARKARITNISKFGELSSGGGSGGLTQAIDVELQDASNYYDSIHLEGALKEIGDDFKNAFPRLKDIEDEAIPRITKLETVDVPRITKLETVDVPRIKELEDKAVPRITALETVQIPRINNLETKAVPRITHLEENAILLSKDGEVVEQGQFEVSPLIEARIQNLPKTVSATEEPPLKTGDHWLKEY